MMKKFLPKIFGVALLTGLLGFWQLPVQAAKLAVVASIYPMAEFCRAVGGNSVEVTQLVPDGSEPHDYEPGPRDLAVLQGARVFVYNGGVEPWALPALAALGKDVAAVQAAEGLMEIDGKNDPHVWVSPKGAMAEVRAICRGFCQADGVNAAVYQNNAAIFLQKLVELDTAYMALGRGKRRTFVTSHGAFGHLAKDYNLLMVPVSGLSPSAEPAPRDLLKVVQAVKQHGVRFVFFETLASPKLAVLVAREAGVQTGILDPIEGIAPGSSATYWDLQRQNLQALQKELQP